MSKKERLQGFAWFCGVVSYMAILSTLVFLTTGWLYNQLGWSLPGLLIQLLNFFVTLFLFGLSILTISSVFRPQIVAGEMKVYGPIIEALEKIAKGDFKVSIENKRRNAAEERVVGELINSVNKMAAELGQLEIMRQEFVSNVSHEIQSPLTSIRGFAGVLRNSGLSDQERSHYLEIIEAESTRLSRLSDNLLKLAALEANQTKIEFKPYRLDRQIRHLILACEPQWLAKELELDICLQEVILTGDEDLLGQVWLNLLHNSIKFTPGQGRIGIKLSCHSDKVIFKICDTGPGISEEDQAHIFERFYKTDKSRTSLTEGSGLGLSITQKIVQIHCGTIEVESKLAAGTTFTIYLPL